MKHKHNRLYIKFIHNNTNEKLCLKLEIGAFFNKDLQKESVCSTIFFEEIKGLLQITYLLSSKSKIKYVNPSSESFKLLQHHIGSCEISYELTYRALGANMAQITDS